MFEAISSTQVTLTHLAPAPFVQQVAKALHDEGMLTRFATTFIKRSEEKWQIALCQLAKIAKYDLAKQLSRREVDDIPLDLVIDRPWKELTRLLVSRIDKQGVFTDIVFHWELTDFDRWVALDNLTDSNVVYGYEYGCLETFKSAKTQGIARIYDVPAPEHDFSENIIHQEIVKYSNLNTAYRKYTKKRQKLRTKRRVEEWNLADVVIANSEFTKKSYADAGLDANKVQVVPYGAPPVYPEAQEGGSKDSQTVNFLWAGTFSIRKGAHYLLSAWKQLEAKSQARLKVFGAMGLPIALLTDIPDFIEFSGTIPRSELYKQYHQADILVFPTLCDGFGMVITEAFAHGLPVITTNRAGAADLIRHGENGLIIPAGNTEALTEALQWCLNHRRELRKMRQAALETAANWQWSDYRRTLVDKLQTGLKMAGYS
jgi:hypothetical protein